jgi:triacylglycerol lipase
MGAPEMVSAADIRYASLLGAVVITPSYRLAPEWRYPAQVDDCYSVLLWMFKNADELGIDPARIGVVGESAGGGIAAALALKARDTGCPPILHQQLIFPMLDDRTEAETNNPSTAKHFVWSHSANKFGWAAMLGVNPGSSGISEYAAPARAASLSHLPSTSIFCGSLDLFIEENMRYAHRLISADVSTELHVYPRTPHAFIVAAEAKVTAQFWQTSLSALRHALA